MTMTFIQPAPELANQYHDDSVLRSYLKRALPPDMLSRIEPELGHMGELAGGALYRLQLADRLNEPRLTQWDAWGNRIDHIEVSPLWREAQRITAETGLIAIPYEAKNGRYSRIHQFALVYLFTPSSDLYSCPLAMTDGAAKTLTVSKNKTLIERALPHLCSRDPSAFWTSGQWMTEATGGSDVGLSETIARKDQSDTWRLYGRKWFTSAITSQMAVTLARPEGNVAGGKGLALFYLETRDEHGQLQNILVHRLKDKLGTRKVPTAELTLNGTPAQLVLGTTDGVRNIAPMLNITRTWNSVSAVSYMRRGLALARDYARKRLAFGAQLADKPLHLDTLAGMQAEMAAGFHLVFYMAEWIGRDETEQLNEEQASLLRLLTPIVKLTTARQSVYVTSETLEAFGGAGYVEDTGLPYLLRDSQVFTIWEGTTNVLALDALRVALTSKAMVAWRAEIHRLTQAIQDAELGKLALAVRDAFDHAQHWLQKNSNIGPELEGGARRLVLSLGRCLALALLINHAQWSLDHEKDKRTLLAAQRFYQNGIDLISEAQSACIQNLAMDIAQ